jgi:transposase-like protein
MEDYPRTVTELESRFSTDQACRAYLFRLRWPDGFRCGRCGGNSCWPTERGLLMCATCGKHTSVMAGTIFERTRTPLPVWFRAIWWVVTQKNGASALGLQRVLGLGSYETAWTWLHKIRRAMVRPDCDRISGRVEIDETYLGGLEEGVRGRETFKKALVVIAAQEDGKAIGRIRMRRIADASAGSLLPFVESAVEPGSLIHTDGWLGYTGLEAKGYGHEVTVLKRSKASASDLLPRVHRVASLLKRWILGTHQGAVSPEHLDGYLDEFTFRFNRRTSQSRGKLFYRLLQNAMAVEPAPYKDVIKGIRGRQPRNHNI